MATQQVSITKIVERLRQLPSDKLDVVYDFVSYLLEKQQGALRRTKSRSDGDDDRL
ncbi:MAG: hypothetical protein KatS3mg023_0020 [Armatimonadota bacterium]|nr:MAG: hypothetical protein KatS3mg023_0020 [Armatimonadota bacterium]